MKYLMLVLLLVGQDVQVGPPPDGPYAHKEGYVCWRHPNQDYEGNHYVKCECKMVACDNHNPLAGSNCLTYCGTKQCVCHADEVCGMDDPTVDGKEKP